MRLKKNILIIVIALAACAGMLALGLHQNRGASSPKETVSAAPDGTASPQATEAPLYLVLTVNDQLYEPIPLTGDEDYTVEQGAIGASNIVHVTKESVSMAHSTCTNQACIQQGEVNLENRETRLLGNMIICLPNKVLVQLMTAEELAQLTGR